MAPKTLLFAVVLLAFAAESAQSAQADQLLGLGQLRINGTVHCCAGPVTATTPVFPNAGVQLHCGNSVVHTTTTNSNGVFNLKVNFITSALPMLLSDCKLVVATPLSTCDHSLSANGLQSALQLLDGGGLVGLIGGILGPILGPIISIVPSGFSLVH